MKRFGSWHWLPAFLLPSVLNGLSSLYLVRFVVSLGLTVSESLWAVNALMCLILYCTRIFWIASSCKRYQESRFYRWFTYGFMCCFVCVIACGRLILPKGTVFSINPSINIIFTTVYPLTPFVVMALTIKYARSRLISLRKHL